MNEKNLEIVNSPTEVKKVLRNLSVQDFKDFGLHQIAYIRDTENSGHIVFGANGQEVCRADTIESALVKAREEHLEPVIVH